MTGFNGAFSGTCFPPSVYLLVPLAYLVGSIPFGVLVAKTRGINLWSTGSGNTGATNVLRIMGKKAALLTLLGDSLKGAAMAMLGRTMAGGDFWEGIVGIAAVIGHVFSVFLSFRGGKGVATGFGMLAVYEPLSALVAFIVWIFTAVFTRYSSLAAITAFLFLPLTFFLLNASRVKISFAIIIAFLIIFKHRANIKRLFNGTESRIGEKAGMDVSGEKT